MTAFGAVEGDPAVPGKIDRVTLEVDGVARPQGSKSYLGHRNGKPVLAESSKGLPAWRARVTKYARALIGDHKPMDGPIELDVSFYLPRPKSHYGARGILGSAPQYPTTYPDLSKLVRAVEDSLTGIVWKDDARVRSLTARKWYADREPPHVVIRVRRDGLVTHGEWMAVLAEGAS